MPKNDPNQTKLFGPKKGLNRAESPLRRAQPSGPNYGAPEFATEFKNFFIDPKDGIMKLRPGFALVNKFIPSPQIGELGISRFNNYDKNGDAQPILICLGRDNSHIVRKGRVKISASDAFNHKLTIIFHPVTGRYEIVNTNTSSGVELDRLSIADTTLTDLNSQLTGLTISGTSDLYNDETYDMDDVDISSLFPVIDMEVTQVSDNELAFDVIEPLISLVDLSTADLDTESSTIATFSEVNNVLYIAIKGLPILKYDEEGSISKAGLPDPEIITGDKSSVFTIGSNFTRGQILNRDEDDFWEDSGLSEEESDNNEVLYRFINDSSDTLGITEPTNNTARKYAIAIQRKNLLSNAIGNENEQRQVEKVNLSNEEIDFIESTNASSQNTSSTNNTTFGTPKDYENVPSITVASLISGSGWSGNSVPITAGGYELANGDGSVWDKVSSIRISSSKSFRKEDIGKDLFFRIRLVSKLTSSLAFSPFTDSHQYTISEYLVSGKLLESVSGTEISKELTFYLQPGGLEGVKTFCNYDKILYNTNEDLPGPDVWASDILTDDIRDGLVGINFLPGYATFDTFINIYRSDDVDRAADVGSSDAEVSYDEDGYPAGSFHLVTQIPSAGGGTFIPVKFYDWFDFNKLGSTYEFVNPVGVTNNSDDDLIDHSSLPKGNIIKSYNGRMYITGDPNAVNTVYGTSLVYGPEVYNATGDDSFEIKDDIGDFITGMAPLGDAFAILKSNSAHLIQGDFATNTIRRDIIVAEGYGCTSHHSIAQVKDGIAFLSEEGVVYWQYNSKPRMMGSVYLSREAGSEPVSRIRDYLFDKTLDMRRAIGFNDFKKELYLLHIPRTTEKSAGLFASNEEEGITLVYDYVNDMWFEYERCEFKGGMAYVGDTLYRANSIGNGSSIIGTTLNREWNTQTLYDFQDNFDLIPYQYDSDWESFLEPSILKKPMHIKVFGYNLYEDVKISGIGLDLTGGFNMRVEMYKDYRDYALHTKNYAQLTERKIEARIKCKSQVLKSAKVSISNIDSRLFKCPCIMGIEVEYQIAHRGFQRESKSS